MLSLMKTILMKSNSNFLLNVKSSRSLQPGNVYDVSHVASTGDFQIQRTEDEEEAISEIGVVHVSRERENTRVGGPSLCSQSPPIKVVQSNLRSHVCFIMIFQ